MFTQAVQIQIQKINFRAVMMATGVLLGTGLTAVGATVFVKKVRRSMQDYADQIELERETEQEITYQILGLMMNCRDNEIIVPIYPPQEPPVVEVGYDGANSKWLGLKANEIDIRGDGNKLLVTYRILNECCNYQQIYDLVIRLGNHGYRHIEERIITI